VAQRTERFEPDVVGDAIRKEIALLRARRAKAEAERAEAQRLADEHMAMLMRDEDAIILLLLAA
jgi:hypothetical protein